MRPAGRCRRSRQRWLLLPAIVALLALQLAMAAQVQARAGDLDPGFGTGGKVTTDFGGSSDQIHGLAVQADGKLVAAGSVTTEEGGENFGVARYHPDGTLDAGFGAGGKVTTRFEGFFNQANAVVVQAGGRIVAAGGLATGPTHAMAVAAYRPNGTLDPGFGSGGKVTIEFAGTGNAAALVALAGGRLVAAGNADPGPGTGQDFALVRLRHNGMLDPGFGMGGKVTTGFGGGPDVARALAVQADGKLVAAGSPDNIGFGSDFGLARYRTRYRR